MYIYIYIFFQAAISESTQQLELLRVEQARVLAANEEEILQERTRAGRYSQHPSLQSFRISNLVVSCLSRISTCMLAANEEGRSSRSACAGKISQKSALKSIFRSNLVSSCLLRNFTCVLATRISGRSARMRVDILKSHRYRWKFSKVSSIVYFQIKSTSVLPFGKIYLLGGNEGARARRYIFLKVIAIAISYVKSSGELSVGNFHPRASSKRGRDLQECR